MREKELEKTQKALEELIKVEYMAISAYEEAIEETEDAKLRRQYGRFRSDHEKQARDLNNRLVELGGEPLEYGVGSGKVKAGLWGKITGMFGDDASIEGMRKGAEDGIRIYLNQLDNIHDSKALGIIRRNLEAKQDEVRWLEQEAVRQHEDSGKKVKEAAEDARKKSGKIVKEVQAAVEDKTEHKKTGLFGVPVWLLLAIVGAAAFFFLRRQEEPDFSDEAFQYETTDFTSESSSGGNGAGYHGIVENAGGESRTDSSV